MSGNAPYPKEGAPDSVGTPTRQYRHEPSPEIIQHASEPREPIKTEDGSGQGTLVYPSARHNDGVPADWSMLVGDLIDDRYRISNTLGLSGGQAELFSCQDENMPEDSPRRRVVLKLYHAGLAAKEEIITRLLDISHPNIIHIYDVKTWRGRFYEVVEHCTGGSLADQQIVSEAELEPYLRQIADGLEFCHAQGIIHRDIKPENLLFRDKERKELIIADFGISSLLSEEEQRGVTDAERLRIKTRTIRHLTPQYASPEQTAMKVVGPKSDYYSLGMTLIHFLMGKSPFPGTWDDGQIAIAHNQRNYSLPDNISDRFKQLLQGLTEIDMQYRWGYSQVLAWLDGETIRSDDGSIWSFDKHRGIASSAKPYPNYQEARTPKELASVLEKINVAKDLRDGTLSYWVRFVIGDDEMFKRIEMVREEFQNNPTNLRQAAARLRYILDRDAALVIKVGR